MRVDQMMLLVNIVIVSVGGLGVLVNVFICYKLWSVQHRRSVFDTGKLSMQ